MKFTAACLQLTSNDQPKENLDQVLQLSEQAIKEKVDFILTPEKDLKISTIVIVLKELKNFQKIIQYGF